jgi:hypothetical protein
MTTLREPEARFFEAAFSFWLASTHRALDLVDTNAPIHKKAHLAFAKLHAPPYGQSLLQISGREGDEVRPIRRRCVAILMLAERDVA